MKKIYTNKSVTNLSIMSLLLVFNIIGVSLRVLPIKIRFTRKLDDTVMYRLIDVKLS